MASSRSSPERSPRRSVRHVSSSTRSPATSGSGGSGLPRTEAAARYRALLKALPDLMFVIHRDGTYTDFWAEEEGELAIPAAEILGKNIGDAPFTPSSLAAIRRSIRSTLRSGNPEVVEYELETMSGLGTFEARIVRLDDLHVLAVVRNITRRRDNEKQLRQASENLAREKEALHEKNIALEQVLRHLEARARDYQSRVARELGREIRPVLKRLQKQVDPECRAEVEQLENRFAAILRRDVDDMGDRYASLSPRELEVCALLRQGMSSKEISERLHVSPTTVHKHREQIRAKLGFQGQRINLSAYLRLHPDPS